MRISRLYLSEPIGSELSASQGLPHSIRVGEHSTHYMNKVLRLKPGTQVCVFDGQGGEYLAEIEHYERRETLLKLIEFHPKNRCSPLNISLGIGLSRSDRFDLVLQKATELGVSAVQPLLSQRSDRKPKTSQLEKKQRHWQGVVSSACEQCGLNIMPKLYAPLTVEQWLQSQEHANGLLLHPEGSPLSMASIQGMVEKFAAFSVAVGPEGGFTEEETALFAKADFAKLSLGERILRTETAPLAILSILQFAAGDLS